MKTENFILNLMLPSIFKITPSDPCLQVFAPLSSLLGHQVCQGWCDQQTTAEVTACYERPRLPSWAFSFTCFRTTCFGGQPVATLKGHSGAYEEAQVVRNLGVPTCTQVSQEVDPPSPHD